jgi:hypothetical protein
MFLSRDVEVVLGVLALIFFALVLLARQYPGVAWLRPFRPPQLSAAQQERQRRRANTYTGIELILFGLILPIGYVALTVMMFNAFKPLWTAGVILTSLVCITLGITAIVKNR